MALPQLLHALSVVLAIFLAIITVHGVEKKTIKYCRDSKCSERKILQSINNSVDPCNDFYEHVCSGWIAENHVPPSWPMVWMKSEFSSLADKTQTQIVEIINATDSNDSEVLKKAKQFFHTCMDSAALQSRGLRPVESILIDNGEWPLIVPSEQWNPKNLRWQQIHENYVDRLRISGLFDVSGEVHHGKAFRTLTLRIPTVPSARKVQRLIRPKRDMKKSGHKSYFIKAAKALKNLRGFNINDDDFNDDIEKMVLFEEKLHKIAQHPTDKNGDDDDDDDDDDEISSSRVTTIEMLQKDWNEAVKKNSEYSIDWLKIINNRFAGTGIVIDKSEKIVIKPQNLVADLAALLQNTSERTIVNYMHWKVIDLIVPFTNSRIKNPTMATMFTRDRLHFCIINHKMFHAVSYMYVKKYFDRESRIKALQMVKDIRDEIKREIRDSSWLDNASILLAQKKIDEMPNFVGYPEWYDEPNKIDEYYSELAVGPDYFENGLAYIKFEKKRKLSRFRTPISNIDIEWLMYPYIANAGYDKETNSLNFPAAILQWPFFVYDRPSIENYGAFGAVVGHEISHAFDREGRLHSKSENKIEWWSQSTKDTYKTRAQCFVDQYNKYVLFMDSRTDKKFYVDGVKNLRENIADNAGFLAGLKAYHNAENRRKLNIVPSRFTNRPTDKSYFYNLAYAFCEWIAPMALPMYATLPHCPSRLRIIGALSNMQEFSEAFNCPVDSPMNRSKKCVLWD